jgi:hypothetical protein
VVTLPPDDTKATYSSGQCGTKIAHMAHLMNEFQLSKRHYAKLEPCIETYHNRILNETIISIYRHYKSIEGYCVGKSSVLCMERRSHRRPNMPSQAPRTPGTATMRFQRCCSRSSTGSLQLRHHVSDAELVHNGVRPMQRSTGTSSLARIHRQPG